MELRANVKYNRVVVKTYIQRGNNIIQRAQKNYARYGPVTYTETECH